MWDCAMLIGAPQWNMMTSIYVTGLLGLNVLMQRHRHRARTHMQPKGPGIAPAQHHRHVEPDSTLQLRLFGSHRNSLYIYILFSSSLTKPEVSAAGSKPRS